MLIMLLSSGKTLCIKLTTEKLVQQEKSTFLLSALKFVSKTEDCQKYEALIPDGMINDDIKLSITYKTYLVYASGKVPSKKARKFKKRAFPKTHIIPALSQRTSQKG
ncbi:hypothetical protein Tco_1554047 [Tanacetum coccineum]